MDKPKLDARIAVTKALRNDIKAQAAHRGVTMFELLRDMYQHWLVDKGVVEFKG